MSVNYTLQRMNDLNHEGETILVPKMILRGRYSSKELAKEMEKYSTFSRSEIMGILTLLSEMIAYKMANGYSVKLDEIGTFTPALSVRKEIETDCQTRTDARHIGVSNILFRPDKTLILNTAMQCKLKKGPQSYGCLYTQYTPEERLEIAQTYLESHEILTVKIYEEIAGLRHTQAASELKLWSRTPESGIGCHGKGSHKVYVRDKAEMK